MAVNFYLSGQNTSTGRLLPPHLPTSPQEPLSHAELSRDTRESLDWDHQGVQHRELHRDFINGPSRELGNLFKSLFSLIFATWQIIFWWPRNFCQEVLPTSYSAVSLIKHWLQHKPCLGNSLSLMTTKSEFTEHRKHIPSLLYASTSDKCSGCSWDLWVDYVPHFFVLWTCLPSVSTTYS